MKGFFSALKIGEKRLAAFFTKGQLISEAISPGFSEENDIFEEILLWPLKWVKKTKKKTHTFTLLT